VVVPLKLRGIGDEFLELQNINIKHVGTLTRAFIQVLKVSAFVLHAISLASPLPLIFDGAVFEDGDAFASLGRLKL
jgi:hypothetical protein